MSYEPTEWKTGDVVTAEKLNKLEEAVGNADNSPLIVSGTTSDNVETLDKTWKEIYDAYVSGRVVLYKEEAENYIHVCSLEDVSMNSQSEPASYEVSFNGEGLTYSTDSENGYPHD